MNLKPPLGINNLKQNKWENYARKVFDTRYTNSLLSDNFSLHFEAKKYVKKEMFDSILKKQNINKKKDKYWRCILLKNEDNFLKNTWKKTKRRILISSWGKPFCLK